MKLGTLNLWGLFNRHGQLIRHTKSKPKETAPSGFEWRPIKVILRAEKKNKRQDL